MTASGVLLSEQIHVVQALAPDADVFAGTVNSDFINIEDYGSIMFVVNIGVGATGTTTLTVTTSDDASGTTTADIAFKYRRVSDTTSSDVPGGFTDATSSGFTTTAGSNQIYLIEVPNGSFDPDKPFIRVNGVEVVDSPIDGSILAILGAPRYGGNTMRTAIA